MRNATHSTQEASHSTQIFSLFGGGYVPEEHGRGLALDEPRKRSGARWAIVLTVALFGVTTTAAAITASSRSCAQVSRSWQQELPANLMKFPGAVGFGEALY
jgi:hypothetical protein